MDYSIIKDGRIINAVLRKLSKEDNNFEIENVFFNVQFKYIETVNVNKRDADFCSTFYKGQLYKVQYVSGSFYPYLTIIN